MITIPDSDKNGKKPPGKRAGRRKEAGMAGPRRGGVSAQVRQVVLILADPEDFHRATSRTAPGTELRACF